MREIFLISREYLPAASGASVAIYNYIKDINSCHFFIISYFSPKKLKENVTVKKIKEKWKSVRYLSATRFVFLTALNSFRGFDCIVGNALIGSSCGTIVKILRRRPLISIIYDIDYLYSGVKNFGRINKFFRRIIISMILKYSDKVIVPSPKVKRDIVNIFGINSGENVIVLPIGVEVKPFEKIKKPKNKRIVLTVGAIMKKRGLEYMINGFRKVVDKIPNTELWIIGGVVNEDYYDGLKMLITKLGLEKNVKFLGQVPDLDGGLNIFSYYNICDVFAISSYHSMGYSLSCVEASLMRKPIVATNLIEDVGVIVDKKTALVVPVKNSEELGDAITRLLINKNLGDRLGKNGRMYVKKFNPTRITKKFESIIKTTILDH